MDKRQYMTAQDVKAMAEEDDGPYPGGKVPLLSKLSFEDDPTPDALFYRRNSRKILEKRARRKRKSD